MQKNSRRAMRIGKAGVSVVLCALFLIYAGCTPAPVDNAVPGTDSPSPSAQTNDVTPEPSIVVRTPEDPAALSIDDVNGIVTDPSDVLPPKQPYDKYVELNSDVLGWLTVPNTQIDYPVVRGTDNEFYLTHNVEKQTSKYGAIFMDYRNADVEQQLHLIIYGHNMKNGTMFHDLNNYKQREFFEQNRRFTFIWQGDETEWEIYLACVWQWKDVYFHHTRFSEVNRKQNFADIMNGIIEYAKKSKYSIVDENIIISASDYVLTLSTCTYEYDNSRFIVSARRVK